MARTVAATVRVWLADHHLVDRPRPERPRLEQRAGQRTDLIGLTEAAELLGLAPSTVRSWATAGRLPYRDALGLATDVPYSSRWHHFAAGDLEEWSTTRVSTSVLDAAPDELS